MLFNLVQWLTGWHLGNMVSVRSLTWHVRQFVATRRHIGFVFVLWSATVSPQKYVILYKYEEQSLVSCLNVVFNCCSALQQIPGLPKPYSFFSFVRKLNGKKT